MPSIRSAFPCLRRSANTPSSATPPGSKNARYVPPRWSNGLPGATFFATPEVAIVAICIELVTVGFFADNWRETGVNVHVDCDGRFEHERSTVPSNPFTEFTVSTTVAYWPAVTVADDGFAVTLNVGTADVAIGFAAATGDDADAA